MDSRPADPRPGPGPPVLVARHRSGRGHNPRATAMTRRFSLGLIRARCELAEATLEAVRHWQAEIRAPAGPGAPAPQGGESSDRAASLREIAEDAAAELRGTPYSGYFDLPEWRYFAELHPAVAEATKKLEE